MAPLLSPARSRGAHLGGERDPRRIPPRRPRPGNGRASCSRIRWTLVPTPSSGDALSSAITHELGHLSGIGTPTSSTRCRAGSTRAGSPLWPSGSDRTAWAATTPAIGFNSGALNPAEGFTGTGDTLNRTAWAYSKGTH